LQDLELQTESSAEAPGEEWCWSNGNVLWVDPVIRADAGSEFVNNRLVHYCNCEHVTKVGSRPFRKNDN